MEEDKDEKKEEKEEERKWEEDEEENAKRRSVGGDRDEGRESKDQASTSKPLSHL